ncbi:neogenin-like [Antedon mediterranea]|uniref:neogenin-like n=1 Tax=Antedon mediterranea TaxID=105859 RepID=UPI003AF9FFE3
MSTIDRLGNTIYLFLVTNANYQRPSATVDIDWKKLQSENRLVKTGGISASKMGFRNLGLFLLTVSVSFAQDFISQPTDTTAYVGQDVTLSCVLNSDHGSHLWVKDSILITQEHSILSHVMGEDGDSTQYKRYSVVPTNIDGYYGYSLRISNVQAQDAGVYQCIVLGGETGLQSQKAALQVLAAPAGDYPECKTDIDNLHVNIGEEITFSCESNGGSPATILKWLRGEDLTEPSETTNTHTWKVTEEDADAVFICEGSHQLWSLPRTCSVGPFKLITGDPAVEISGVNDVDVGSTAVFVCQAFHISNPDYTWYIDGAVINPNDERITYRNFGSSATMDIRDVTLADAGASVQCRVNYFAGTLPSDILILNVQPLPTTTLTPATTPLNNLDDIENEALDSNKSEVSNSTIIGVTMGIIALVLIVLIIVGIVVIRRAALKMKEQDAANGENFTMRSRYVGVLRSWFFPVHEHTQKSMASFVSGPAMDNKGFQS